MGTYQQKKNISKIIKVNQIVDVAFETNSIFPGEDEGASGRVPGHQGGRGE